MIYNVYIRQMLTCLFVTVIYVSIDTSAEERQAQSKTLVQSPIDKLYFK